MWCSSAKQCGSFPELPLSVHIVTFQPTQFIRNLGVLIRSDLSLLTKLAWLYAAASTAFDNFPLCAAHWIIKPCAMQPTRLPYPELIFAIQFTPDSPSFSQLIFAIQFTSDSYSLSQDNNRSLSICLQE